MVMGYYDNRHFALGIVGGWLKLSTCKYTAARNCVQWSWHYQSSFEVKLRPKPRMLILRVLLGGELPVVNQVKTWDQRQAAKRHIAVTEKVETTITSPAWHGNWHESLNIRNWWSSKIRHWTHWASTFIVHWSHNKAGLKSTSHSEF